MPSDVKDQLQIRLSEHLEATLAARVVEGLARTTERPDALQAILVLLKELDDVSGKAAKMASETFPELERRGLLGHAVPWLDLGLAIAQVSGAASLRYFKESALLLSLIEPPRARDIVLRLGLELRKRIIRSRLSFFALRRSVYRSFLRKHWSDGLSSAPTWHGQTTWSAWSFFGRSPPSLACLQPMRFVPGSSWV